MASPEHALVLVRLFAMRHQRFDDDHVARGGDGIAGRSRSDPGHPSCRRRLPDPVPGMPDAGCHCRSRSGAGNAHARLPEPPGRRPAPGWAFHCRAAAAGMPRHGMPPLACHCRRHAASCRLHRRGPIAAHFVFRIHPFGAAGPSSFFFFFLSSSSSPYGFPPSPCRCPCHRPLPPPSYAPLLPSPPPLPIGPALPPLPRRRVLLGLLLLLFRRRRVLQFRQAGLRRPLQRAGTAPGQCRVSSLMGGNTSGSSRLLPACPVADPTA